MQPPKRKKANINEIFKHPIQSDKQKPLSYKKEGFWGWLSYVGWMFFVSAIFVNLINSYLEYHGLFNTYVFFLSNFKTIIGILGIILSLIIIYKSAYKMSQILKKILITFLMLLTCVVEVIALTITRNDLFYFNILYFVGVLCLFLLIWYILFFYKKSKCGYKYVWLKVFVFTVIPFLPLLFFKNEYEMLMGDYMADVPLDEDVGFN